MGAMYHNLLGRGRQKTRYHFLFFLAIEAEAFETCKKTIKCFNLLVLCVHLIILAELMEIFSNLELINYFSISGDTKELKSYQ